MVVGLRDRGVPLERTVILGAARTPFGRFGGALSPLGAAELGGAAIRDAIDRSGIEDGDLQHSIFGIVVQAGVGQIPSRQANFHAGLTFSLTTETLNQVCASGLRSATLAETLIRAGDYDVIVAGGMESMSNVPYLLPKARWGARMGDMPALDAMMHDGLLDAFEHVNMIRRGYRRRAATRRDRRRQSPWQKGTGRLRRGRRADPARHHPGEAGISRAYRRRWHRDRGQRPWRHRRRRRPGAHRRELRRKARPQTARFNSGSRQSSRGTAQPAHCSRKRGQTRARKSQMERGRPGPGRDKRGFRWRHDPLHEDTRRRPRHRQRQRRRPGARPPRRRIRRAHPDDAPLRAAAQGRRKRSRGHLLRRRPGRRRAGGSMSEEENNADNPGVIAPPPLIYASALAAGLLANRRYHIPILPRGVARTLGWPLVACGLAVGFLGAREMRMGETNMDPYKPATAVVTGGPFRFTRNPLYLSMTLIYGGISALANALL